MALFWIAILALFGSALNVMTGDAITAAIGGACGGFALGVHVATA